MIATVDVSQKSIGNKQLLKDLRFSIEDHEKLAIIGRNGVGKTTLFGILAGIDQDFSGSVTFRNGVRVMATRQEHHDVDDELVIRYIVENLPEYAELKLILDTYPDTMGDNIRKITIYSEALERFSQLDYYTVEDRIRRSLADYQLGAAADRPMRSLSGGQKRFVELIRVEYSDADVALIDEPTNHMDYVAKAAFLKWFAATKHAVVVITHDRDLLQQVERIIEIKDMTAHNFPGNYDAYLKQNAARTMGVLNNYDTMQRRIANIKKQIIFARSKKASWGGTADKKNPFVVMEDKLVKELKGLESEERPSFWIDQESINSLQPKMEENYQKHKAKSIHIRRVVQEERTRDLLQLENIQAGYGKALFKPLSLSVQTGERVQIIGRNGVGKTTLVKTIMGFTEKHRPETLLAGDIKLDSKLTINSYEQELDSSLLDLTLAQAIKQMYNGFEIPISNEEIMRILSEYLFDPYGDREHLVRNLSGGQKARLQLIKLFANKPNLIIVDEPTNHLDLPSIEELESVLKQYAGSLLYISHDSYLAKHLGGEALTIQPVDQKAE